MAAEKLGGYSTKNGKIYQVKYDTPGVLVIAMILLAVLALVLAYYSPLYALSDMEITGARLIAIYVIVLSLLLTWRWKFGTKVKVSSDEEDYRTELDLMPDREKHRQGLC